MKILFSDDYIIDDKMRPDHGGILVLGEDRIQIYSKNNNEEVLCFTYGQIVTVTIEVLSEVRKTRVLVFDIATGTHFRLNLNIQTTTQLFELQPDLTVEELKQLFDRLDQQKVVIHDPVHLRAFYLQPHGSLQAYVAKQLSELYPF